VVQRKELAMEKKLSGEEHLFVANSLQALGFVLRDSHNPDQAEVMFREALGMRRKLLGNENPLVASSLYWLGTALSVQGKHAEAEAAYREALEIRRKLPIATQLQVANLLDSLGQEIRLQGKHADAEPLYREALAIRRKLLGNQHPDVAISLENLAYELRLQGKRAEGEALYREALAMRRRLLGNEHPSVATSFSYVISALREDGKLDEAEALLRDELVQVQTPGTNAPAQVSARLGFALYSLAGVRRERKSLNEARSLAEEAYTLYQRYPDWPELQRRQASWVLRLVLTDLGDSAGLEALELRKLNDLRARVSDLRARRPADDPQLAAACSELLGTLHLAKKFAEAEPLYRELLASREAMIPDDWRTFNTRSILGDCLLGQTNYAAAEPLLLSGYEGMKQREDKIPAASKRHVKETIQRLVKLYEATDQPEKAAEWKKKLAEFNQAEAENVYRELLPLRSKLSADDPQLAAALARLTQTLLAQGKFDVAESLARECLSIREKKLPDDWLTFNARSMLGTSLLLQTDYDAAEPLLISGYEGMRQRMDKIPAGSKRYVKETGQRLVQLYEATDKPEQAAEWKKKLADFNQP
jgi:tetratricopeptide (TPR) repeat protein